MNLKKFTRSNVETYLAVAHWAVLWWMQCQQKFAPASERQTSATPIMAGPTAKGRSASNKSLSAQEVDSKIESALSVVLERLRKIEERVPESVPAISDLRNLVAVEVEKLAPPAALTPPVAAPEPTCRGMFPCINSLSRKENLERLRALIERCVVTSLLSLR